MGSHDTCEICLKILNLVIRRCSNPRLNRVGSEKLRKDTGWKNRRQSFSKGLRIYRKAYEAAVAQNHANVQKIEALVDMV